MEKLSKKATFSKETRIKIFLKFNGRCGQCGSKQALEIHHLIHNTIPNRKKYGDERVQGEDNGYVCCKKHHDNYSLWDGEFRNKLKNKWDEELSQERKEKMEKLNTSVTESYKLEPKEFIVFKEQNFSGVEVWASKEVKNNSGLIFAQEAQFSFSSGDVIREICVNSGLKLNMDMLDFSITNNNDHPIEVTVNYKTKE